MTETAVVVEQRVSLVKSVVEVLSLVHTEYGGELFVTESLGAVGRGRLSDEHFGIRRHLKAANFCNCHGALTDYLRVQSAVYEHGVAHLVGFLVVKEVAAASLEFLLDLGVNRLIDDYGLLGGAYHAVVEGL